jgi:hypothetical protein
MSLRRVILLHHELMTSHNLSATARNTAMIEAGTLYRRSSSATCSASDPGTAGR